MTNTLSKDQIMEELEALKRLLNLAAFSIQNDYPFAAGEYLEDAMFEAAALSDECLALAKNKKSPVPANFLHPNHPDFIPYAE